MVVAGFRHLTSRNRDPQLHTHCVLANMTRNASGEWKSVEPTKIKRCEKLIGAYYRNELARRLEALNMAVTPRMVGRIPEPQPLRGGTVRQAGQISRLRVSAPRGPLQNDGLLLVCLDGISNLSAARLPSPPA